MPEDLFATQMDQITESCSSGAHTTPGERPLLPRKHGKSYNTTTCHAPPTRQPSPQPGATCIPMPTSSSSPPPDGNDDDGARQDPQLPRPSWRTLPHKPQLLILLLASLSGPLAQYSQTPYLFHQVRWFDPALSSSEIALRAAYLTAAFAGAQCATALLWGALADHVRVGRKVVLVVGLLGSAIAAVGIGFVRTFEAAVVWRIVAGAVTGNGGVGRVVVAEVVGGVRDGNDDDGGGNDGGEQIEDQERRKRDFQARAFLLLPMCYNVGVIVGPLVGGLLADPGRMLPDLVGAVKRVETQKEEQWFWRFPFALPNLVFAVLFGAIAVVVVLGLDETHPRLRGRTDCGREIWSWIMRRTCRRCETKDQARASRMICAEQEEAIGRNEDQAMSTETTVVETSPLLSRADTPVAEAYDGTDGDPSCSTASNRAPRLFGYEQQVVTLPQPSSPFRTILTSPNILLTMLLRFLQSLHISAFYAIYTVLLPTPRRDPKAFHTPLFFSGGLGLSPQKMGLANTIVGMIGLPLQILVYPYLVTKIGVRKSYAMFLPLSIAAYVLLPFLILIPTKQDGWLWICLCGTLGLQVLSRTFVNPAGIMLVNDCAPRGEMLGSVHGLGVTVSSAAKIVGPLAGGAMLGWGLANGCVVVPLWVLGGVAGLNWVVLGWVRDNQK